MIKYDLSNRFVDAIYTATLPRISEGNPLIEALPNFSDEKELRKLLLNKIPYDESERSMEPTDRLEAIESIYHCFYALPIHMELANSFKRALKSGYLGRNPRETEHTASLYRLANCARKKDSEFQTFMPTNATAAGFSLIGVSGMGKTSTINRILGMYPQVIYHAKYKEEDFAFLQIVWMKLECPYDGGIKGFCASFFRKFDELTNDTTYAKYANYSKATIDTMIPQMALIARRHGLGALIIDEIQNINIAKSGGKEKMLNFLKNLVNTIGVPVIVIGTPDSIQTLSGNLQDVRRFSGEQGFKFMEPIQYEDPTWKMFLKSIWKFQWTNIETELTDELSFAIHSNCGGIIGEAVKLYAFTQERAITKGRYADEKITVELINDAANSDKFFGEKQKISQILLGEQEKIDKYKNCNPIEPAMIVQGKESKQVTDIDTVINDEEFPILENTVESSIKLMIDRGESGEEMLRQYGLLCQMND